MMNEKLQQAYLLEGLLEARDVLDGRISEIQDNLGLTDEDIEVTADGGPDNPLVQNAAAARQALAKMREEYRQLGGIGTFSKSKLEALRRRLKAKTAGGA